MIAASSPRKPFSWARFLLYMAALAGISLYSLLPANLGARLPAVPDAPRGAQVLQPGPQAQAQALQYGMDPQLVQAQINGANARSRAGENDGGHA